MLKWNYFRLVVIDKREMLQKKIKALIAQASQPISLDNKIQLEPNFDWNQIGIVS